MYLAGFRNRVSVLIEWGYSYFTYERGARLITHGGELTQGIAVCRLTTGERRRELAGLASDACLANPDGLLRTRTDC